MTNRYEPLLKLARETLETYIRSGDHPEFEVKDPSEEEHLGCFVTLMKTGSLRGCIGTFLTEQPLYQNVMRMTIAAATQDTRFERVTKDELPLIEIELSILGALQRVNDFQEIEIGRHGVYVKYGDRSGTYLPQVATEQNWDTIQFITECAREKAGLKPQEIAQAEIYRYEVVKLAE